MKRLVNLLVATGVAISSLLATSYPVKAEIYKRLPALPNGCQWVFIGYNHDNNLVYRQRCDGALFNDSYQQTIIYNSYPYTSYYDDGYYNRSGFSINFGDGGFFPFFGIHNRPHHEIWNWGGHRRGGGRHHDGWHNNHR
jgi:hypothetical protein